MKKNRNRIIGMVIVIMLAFGVIPNISFTEAYAASDVSNVDYEFAASTGTLTIKTNMGTTAWHLDEKIIGSGAPNYTAVQSLKLTSGITAINNYAFMSCTNLRGSITIPGSVKSIGESAFLGCRGITALDLSSFAGSIGRRAFANCTGLSDTLTIPARVTDIGEGAFLSCNKIAALDLTSYTGSIGDSAFSDCNNLSGTLTIPARVTDIKAFAFSGDTQLEVVLIGSAVPSLGSGWANNVQAVYYPNIWGAVTNIINMPETAITYPPILSDESVSAETQTGATLGFKSDMAGTYDYLVYRDVAPAPSAVTIKAQQASGETKAQGTGQIAAASRVSENISGLEADTSYKAYVIVEDALGNISDVSAVSFRTLVPVATYEVKEHFGTFHGTGTVTAKVDAGSAKFEKLLSGENAVSPLDYRVTQSGDTQITLTESQLQSYANGAYVFTAEFENGVSEPINLAVSVNEDTGNVDENNGSGDSCGSGGASGGNGDGSESNNNDGSGSVDNAGNSDGNHNSGGSIGVNGDDSNNRGNAVRSKDRGNADSVKVTGVITLSKIYVVKGKSVKLPVAVRPLNAVNKGVIWSVKNAKIAKINAKTGKLKALKKGKTIVTVTSADGKKIAKCKVFVVAKASALKKLNITPKKLNVKPKKAVNLAKGKTLSVKVKLNPGKATGIVPKLKSSRPSVARIDAMGMITALNPGKAKITVKAGKLKRTFVVIVGR